MSVYTFTRLPRCALNTCLSMTAFRMALRPQYGHWNRGSFPHSHFWWYLTFFSARYTFGHPGQANGRAFLVVLCIGPVGVSRGASGSCSGSGIQTCWMESKNEAEGSKLVLDIWYSTCKVFIYGHCFLKGILLILLNSENVSAKWDSEKGKWNSFNYYYYIFIIYLLLQNNCTYKYCWIYIND